MTIDLIKSEKAKLYKENPGLKKIMISFLWETKSQIRNIDISSVALLLDENNILINDESIICYSNKFSKDKSIIHSKNTYSDENEIFLIDLSKIKAQSVLFAVVLFSSEYESTTSLEQIKYVTFKIYNGETDQVIYEFDLTEDMGNATSMEMFKLYKHNGEWKFNALGEKVGISKNGLEDVYKKYSK